MTRNGPGRWLLAAFLIFWLCGWLAGEVAALASLCSPWVAFPLPAGFPRLPVAEGSARAFLIVWLTLWTFGGAVAIVGLARLWRHGEPPRPPEPAEIAPPAGPAALPPRWEEAIDPSGMAVARSTERSRRQAFGCVSLIALGFVVWVIGVYLLEKHVAVPLVVFGAFVSGLLFLLALEREELVAARDHLEVRHGLGPWKWSRSFDGASLRLVVWEDSDGDLNHRIDVVTPGRDVRIWSCGSDRTTALLLATWIASRTRWRLDEVRK